MRTKRLIQAVSLTAILALTGAACMNSDDSTTPADNSGIDETPTTGTETATPDYVASYALIGDAYHHMYMTGDVLSSAIAKQKNLGETATPAGDLRVALARLLGEHGVLAALTTQKGLDGAPDFEASAGLLDKNSNALGEAIGSVYGEDAKTAFLKQWKDHIRMFVDFTVGTAKGDEAMRNAAVAELDGYTKTFGEFLGTATGLPGPAVTEILKEHVSQLAGALDAYKAKDFAKSYDLVREGYHHMVMTGDALAGAIAKQKNLGETNTPAIDLRVAMGQLLGEHGVLAAFATQKGFGGKDDFMPIAGALDKNSDALGEAIGSVYGTEAKTAFLKQWKDHIRMFVDFTVGTATKDTAKRDAAVAELGGYTKTFGTFLATATGLPAEAVQKSLEEHVGQLAGALDAFAGHKS